jgi:hypothetical protein
MTGPEPSWIALLMRDLEALRSPNPVEIQPVRRGSFDVRSTFRTQHLSRQGPAQAWAARNRAIKSGLRSALNASESKHSPGASLIAADCAGAR